MAPLVKGGGEKAVGQNIRELHKGPQFTKTEAKFGKAKADKQAIAIAESVKREKPERKKR